MILGLTSLLPLSAPESLTASPTEDLIVVTAERSPRPLEDSPVAVTPLAADDNMSRLAEHPAEILNRAPGVLIEAGSGQEHLSSIRSPVLTGGAGAGSFLYLQDGVPLRSAGFANVNGLFDAMTPFAERVEVVRGPGDVTYGANAVHGAVNVISPSPLGDPYGRVRLGAGEFDRYSATLETRREAGEKGGIYGALHAYRDGGYREDSGVDQIKAQLAHGWESGGLRITSRASYHHLEQETAGYVEGEDAYRDDDLQRSNPNPEAFRNIDHLVLSSEIVREGERGTLTVTPYAIATDMTFRMHFLPSQALEETGHIAAGVQSSWRRALGARTELLTGLDGEWAKGDLTETQTAPDIFSYLQGVHYDYEVESLSAAPFLRLRHQATERLAVQAGARLNYQHYDYNSNLPAGTLGGLLRPADRSDDFTALSGRIGAVYDLGGGASLIASYARGARPPQTSDLYRLRINQTVDGVEPETLDMVEAGFRYFSDRITAEIVGYVGHKENFLFRDADGFTVDDGTTDHVGVEFLLDWAVTESVNWRAAGTVADHRYGFDRQVARSSDIIREGTEIDTAPGTMLSTTLSWRPLPPLLVETELTHVGSYKTDAAGTQSYPGHEVIDLSAAWDISNRVRLSGEISNLTDERYATRADYAFGNERYFPGEERAIKAAVTFNW